MATSSQLPGLLVLAETIEEVFQLGPDIAKELIAAMKDKRRCEFYGRNS